MTTPRVLDGPDEVVINASEDQDWQENGDGHERNSSLPLTAAADTATNPKEIAKQISNLLSLKGIPQRLFAEKVLNRSQGSFSDYLTKAPAEMPKTHSRAIWIKMKEFLESQEQQQELMEMKRSN